MRDNFNLCLTYLLPDEGGFVNDPQDPGGETNEGVTQTTYDAYRRAHGLPLQDVRDIKDVEVEAIYHSRYWDLISGDDLPSGLDYCVFDFAVNSGIKRATLHLQKVLGVLCDGQLGPITVAAAKRQPIDHLIDDVCDDRQMYLETLGGFRHFGHGWSNRVARVRARAKVMANA